MPSPRVHVRGRSKPRPCVYSLPRFARLSTPRVVSNPPPVLFPSHGRQPPSQGFWPHDSPPVDRTLFHLDLVANHTGVFLWPPQPADVQFPRRAYEPPSSTSPNMNSPLSFGWILRLAHLASAQRFFVSSQLSEGVSG